MRADFAKCLTEMDLTRRILEIGPLDNPILTKDEADVYYADIHPQKEIQKIYQHEQVVRQDRIVPIDFVISTSYEQALSGVPRFKYVLMTHVLEHIPRLIDFFQDIATVLEPGGIFYTFMPDHRYCFDHYRHPTSFAEAYHVHTSGLPFATWRVLDYYVEMARMEVPIFYWHEKEKARINLTVPRHDMAEAMEAYEEALKNPAGVDNCHFSVFSPHSFLLLLLNLVRAGLLPFTMATFFPTVERDYTFGIALQVSPELLHDTDRQRAEANKLIALFDHLPK